MNIAAANIIIHKNNNFKDILQDAVISSEMKILLLL